MIKFTKIDREPVVLKHFTKCLLLLIFTLMVNQLSADRIQQSRRDTLTARHVRDTTTFQKFEIPENEVDTSFKPDPTQNIWLGAVIPGYGQIVNRKYWKLPIVYGGFLGCTYAITWNAHRYLSYKNAYLDITDTNAATNSFLDILPEGYTIESMGGEQSYSNLLKTWMDKSRYNRDLSVIVTVAYYGLTLIDAFVDAHLYDFDISPDLSFKIRPALIKNQDIQWSGQGYTYGVKGSLNF